MKHYFFIQWDATSRCNLSCKHCYHKGIEELRRDMNFEEAIQMLDDLFSTTKRWKINGGVHFSGGEPLLREDIFELIKYAKNKKLDIRLLTNGTLINSKMAKKLKESGVKKVQVSLDGDKETHNKIRNNPLAYDLTISAIKYLKENDTFVVVSSTLNKLNMSNLENIISISAESGADRIGFTSLVPIGRGENLDFLNAEETMEVYLKLGHLSEKYKGKITILKNEVLWRILTPETKFQSIGRELNKLCGGCAVGYSGFAVLSDGVVYPCRRMPIEIGNILEDGLSKIFVESQILKDCRDTTKIEGCNKCEKVTYCRGCRAMAYAVNGDYLKKDPQCFKHLIEE